MASKALPQIDVTTDEWAIIHGLLQKHFPEKEIWAFGSRATRKSKKFSDLDLALIGKEPILNAAKLALQEDFAESDLPYKVDLVDWAVASSEFKKIIESQHVVIQE